MTANEALQRVTLMASGDSAWDFSENDIAALKLTLLEIENLRRVNDALVEREYSDGQHIHRMEDALKQIIRDGEEIEVGCAWCRELCDSHFTDCPVTVAREALEETR